MGPEIHCNELLPAGSMQEEVDKLKQEAWRHSDPQIREKMKKFVL